jgi:hypothetical protein
LPVALASEGANGTRQPRIAIVSGSGVRRSPGEPGERQQPGPGVTDWRHAPGLSSMRRLAASSDALRRACATVEAGSETRLPFQFSCSHGHCSDSWVPSERCSAVGAGPTNRQDARQRRHTAQSKQAGPPSIQDKFKPGEPSSCSLPRCCPCRWNSFPSTRASAASASCDRG